MRGWPRRDAESSDPLHPPGGAKADAEYRSCDREEEYAADRYALDLLARLPGNPPACLAMVTLLERLQDQGGNRVKDHPLPAERTKAARERCQEERRTLPVL